MTGLHRVVFIPSGLEGKVADGTTVLDAARQLGADLDTVCGGRGVCGHCQVTPSFGRFAKWRIDAGPESLTGPAATERAYRGHRPLAPGNRLGCAARIVGDVVVDVPPASQVHRPVVRKDLAGVDFGTETVDPFFCLAYDGEVTVAVATDDSDDVVAVWPGYVDSALGVAVDVGSTTLAGHLCDLSSGEVLASAGRMNPQIRFGEDLMSRVSYVMMNPGGAAELTAAVRTALGELVGELVGAAGVERSRVLDVVLVGNPIMHHLALGFDPTPLGTAPFTLATTEPVTGRAADLDLGLPNARFYAAPCIAGHVGADAAAAILAERPHRGGAPTLLVDVGTNAEIVLGDGDRLFAASSPTGPAFEGAQISCGQRATVGAIERVRIDPETLEPELGIIGGGSSATGVCGSGIIDAVAQMVLTGIVDSGGTIRGELTSRTRRVVADGRTFSYALYDDRETRLAITQNDVRAVQLAKAALRAGVEVLLDHAGRPELAEIRLAGAFGAHIDADHAVVLGMVPAAARVRAVGNAAGTGAVHALFSRARRAELEAAARDVVKIETATEPRFQELFVAAMPFSTPPPKPTARELVAGMCFELVPLKSVEAAIAELAPASRVSVTCSPAKGLAATQDLVTRLLDLGHDAIPHLAARQVEDRGHVARLAAWIRRCGLGEVFVIAGDAPNAAGPYADSISFLRDLLEHDTGLERIGVAAYPDGHPFIDDATLHRVLHEKQALLAAAGLGGSVTTQLCFAATRVREWLAVERARGLTLPVAVGVPGVVDRGKLMAMSLRIGVGTSLRYLRKNRRAMTTLLAPGGYDPTALVAALTEDAGALGATGIHAFTFNSVAATRAWQRAFLGS